MHVLRFFLIPRTTPEFGSAEARRCIRVPTQRPKRLSQPSTDTLATLCRTTHTANPTFSRPLINLLPSKLPFKSHSAPRPPQAPAASS